MTCSIRAHSTISDLKPATAESAALDIDISQDFTIAPSQRPCKVPTGIFGPIPEGMAGLMMGHGSLTLKNVKVHLGVIDSDYKREISVMITIPCTWSFKAGEKIAQLLPYYMPSFSNNKRIGI